MRHQDELGKGERVQSEARTRISREDFFGPRVNGSRPWQGTKVTAEKLSRFQISLTKMMVIKLRKTGSAGLRYSRVNETCILC